MSIDFSRLHTASSADSVLEPREIFRALPAKNPRYQFPRDVQTEAWTRWFERRAQRDLVVKMNTGSGKTVVGLILLKSCLNEGVFPAVYVAPTPQLADQVANEGRSLGLVVEKDPDSLTVLRGQAIAITTIKTLFNGRSRFGIADEGPRIEIGAVVIDDAHACLHETEGQFTLTLPAGSDGYNKMLELFRDALTQQAGTRMQELLEHEPNTRYQVPFWAWHSKLTQVGEVLYALRATKEVEWAWPLLRSVLAECRCVVGEGSVEISPRMIPVDLIPSFVNAQRRVFMTATLADDSVLVSHFDVDPAAVDCLVVPNSANDIGDRMILVPQALNPALTDEDLRTYLAAKARECNVVVIVPSGFRANFWKDVAAQVLTADILVSGVESLRRGHVGLTVIVNRYDGIDLPDDACRVLVIDGLPDVRRLIDKVEQGVRHGSATMRAEAIQRIEQGMGRGNRSANDWCVVLLMSRRLTGHLYAGGAQTRFTDATRVQFELSEQLASQLGGATIRQLDEALNHCLRRSPAWVTPSKNALVGIRYATAGRIDPVVVARRHAFNAARISDLSAAVQYSRDAVELATDRPTRGWLLAEQASYQHRIDPAQAQVTQRAAKQTNPQVTTPLDGITYQRLTGNLANQALRCQQHLRARFSSGSELVVAVNALLDDLKFEPETAPAFERAFRDLGELLGFEAQRPESEFGRGPDVLWKMGGLQFTVIECKNGAITDRVSKRDCDQLAGSVNWFHQEYDRSCTSQPLMVHPSTRVSADATFGPGTRVMPASKLDALKDSVRSLAVASAAKPQFGTDQDLAGILAHYGLTAGEIIQRYAVPFQ